MSDYVFFACLTGAFLVGFLFGVAFAVGLAAVMQSSKISQRETAEQFNGGYN